ncbi:MAG TPA: putative cobaltochelatase [Methanothrix sp.]|jgi:magnesium chelatase subunit D|nr:putative cobaltochelatase [Methanothrix sp.]HRS85951.1 putative cobaltochelatase [Methanothrix sp.]
MKEAMTMHHLKRRTIPFTSIIGQDDMKLALILNAINPRIGGVLIRGDKGTAKSTAVRSLAALLEDISVVEDCPFNCDPENPQSMCDLCFEKSQNGQIMSVKKNTPVIDLPLGATEDRVVGSLNVERAIKDGIKALEPGILAACNRGILYIDEVNLLDDHVADVLLDSAAMGINIVEREGVSVAHPSRFILVGTMNPEEGEIRPQLLDRFGLQVSVAGIEDVEQRMQIAKMADAFDIDPDGFAGAYQADQDRLKEQIRRARELLGKVTLSDDLLRTIAATCIDLGVRTHRAEIVISRTAKTIAAFNGRTDASSGDVKKAMEMALAHRMRSRPFEPPTLNRDRLDKSLEKQHEHQQQKSPPRGQQKPQQQKRQDEVHPDSQQKEREAASAQEQIFDIGSPIDVRKMKLPRSRDRVMRRNVSGRRMKTLAARKAGRYLRQRMPTGGMDIAIDATIRAAAPYQKSRPGKNAIKVKDEDIREKERAGRTSAMVLFVVDASGSMGAMQRMESAKGAVLSLLMDSYQKRDKIGMVAFKGRDAELILPPCSSVDLALSRLKDLPTGGKTPLSAGLSRGLQILEGEMRRDEEIKPMMVLISDGRANVGMGGKIKDELLEISERSRQMGVSTIVIDTEVVESSFMDLRLGYCRDIADTAGGRYYPISGLTPEALYSIIDLEHRRLFNT